MLGSGSSRSDGLGSGSGEGLVVGLGAVFGAGLVDELGLGPEEGVVVEGNSVVGIVSSSGPSGLVESLRSIIALRSMSG